VDRAGNGAPPMTRPAVAARRPALPVDQAVILAGGKGTRLGELTKAKPKPLMPITPDGASFLELAVAEYARQGFANIVIVAGYLGDQIAELMEGRRFGSARVRVVIETEALGTAGALLAAEPLLQERFLVANGDSFIDANFRALAATPVAPGQGAMLVRRIDNAARYGMVDVEDGFVRKFSEKSAQAVPGLINAGVYLLDRTILDAITATPFSMETQVFPNMAADGRLRCVESDGYFIDIGLPDFLNEARSVLHDRLRRPAVFFDRDGVLNRDIGYVGRREQFEWTPGAIDFIRAVNDAKLRVVVITNQAGVARGKYSIDDVHALHDWMARVLAEKGAFVDRFYYCPYHVEGSIAAYRAEHPERKPKPGMLLRAGHELDIDIARSVMIGDKQLDMDAARAAGVHGVRVEGEDVGRAFASARDWLGSRGVRLGLTG